MGRKLVLLLLVLSVAGTALASRRDTFIVTTPECGVQVEGASAWADRDDGQTETSAHIRNVGKLSIRAIQLKWEARNGFDEILATFVTERSFNHPLKPKKRSRVKGEPGKVGMDALSFRVEVARVGFSDGTICATERPDVPTSAR